MRIAITILLILGIFEWTINGEKYGVIRTLFNLAGLICFIIYAY